MAKGRNMFLKDRITKSIIISFYLTSTSTFKGTFFGLGLEWCSVTGRKASRDNRR